MGAAALGLRLVLLALPFDFAGPDSSSYWDMASSLASGQGLIDPQATTARPPGYPVFLAACFLVAGGPSAVAARVAQAGLGALCALFAYGAIEPRHGSRAGWLAAVVVALDPIAAGQAPFLLREALLMALVTGVWVAIVRLRGRTRLLTLGVLLGGLVLTHPLYLLLGPALACADLVARGRRAFVPWAAVGLVVAVAAGGWCLRNARATGRFALNPVASTVPAHELWLTSSCPNLWLSGDPTTGFQAQAWAEERALLAAHGVEGTKRELYRRARENWSEHPVRSLGRLARQNAWYWLEVPGAIKLVEHPRLHWVRWGLVAFLWVRLTGVAAAVIWVWRRGWAPHRFELALLAFFALAPALLYPIPRYLAPACPLLDGLAAIAIARSRGWWT
ncbi:MAG: glycosyltransferase family 39 protein [Planctomycetes bacterium]|nr:glycosyltransferase family 39 protein [Planctomycetota bacterium]